MFLASFSTDDDSLSQWRAYADNGAGVALGFDLSNIPKEPIGDGLSHAGLVKCEYRLNTQREAIISCLEPQMALAARYGHAFVQREVAIAAAGSALVTVNELGMALKNPGFKEEKEWRLVAMAARNEPVPEALSFRNTDFGPAPYVPIKLGTAGLDRLRDVVLGPRVDPIAERSVRLVDRL